MVKTLTVRERSTKRRKSHMITTEDPNSNNTLFISGIDYVIDRSNIKGDVNPLVDILQGAFGMMSLVKEETTKEAKESIGGIFHQGLEKLMAKNNVLTEEEIKDEQELIYYIKTLFNEESKNSEFIYAVAKKPDMPYNLTAISHNSLLKSDH